MEDYKRQNREVPEQVKQRISQKLKAYNQQHPRTPEHCEKISTGLRNYWSQIPAHDISVEDGDIV